MSTESEDSFWWQYGGGLEIRDESKELGTRRGGAETWEWYQCMCWWVFKCFFFLIWLSLNFRSQTLQNTQSMTASLGDGGEPLSPSHVMKLKSWASCNRAGLLVCFCVCVYVCCGEDGRGVGDDSTHYSTTCHLWAHIYWEVRGCKKKARQCGSRPGSHYITFRADEFLRCKMPNFYIKDLGLKGYKWLCNTIRVDWLGSIKV